MILQLVSAGNPMALQSFFHGCQHCIFRVLIQGIGLHNEIPGIHAAKALLRPGIQAQSGGDHHQHHGGQDTDGGQARAVLLHPVGHRRNGHKMIGPVIISLIFLQKLQKGHGTGNKHQIGSQDHQSHSPEEYNHSNQRILDGQGQIIGKAQHQHPQNRQHPVGLGRLLSHPVAFQQFPGIGKMHLPQSVEKDQQKDHSEQRRCQRQRLRVHQKAEADGSVQDIGKDQFPQFGQQDSGGHTGSQGDPGDHHAFPEQNPGQISLVHPQHIVQAEFFFSPADQEGIGVKEKDHREDPCDPGSHTQHQLQRVPSPEGSQPGIPGQKADDIKHHHHAHAGEDIGEVHLPVFGDACQSQLQIKSFFHTGSPPDASTVNVSEIVWNI